MSFIIARMELQCNNIKSDWSPGGCRRSIWIIVTARDVFESSDELIWPEKIDCGHSDHDEATGAS